MPDTVLIRCTGCSTLNRVPRSRIAEQPHCGTCKTPLTVPHAPVNGTTATFDRELSTWPEFLLVEFWAKWCGYCRMIEPVVNDIANWKAGRLKVLKIDVDAEPELSRRFQTRATPTFIMFKNGGHLGRMDGAPKEKLEFLQWVDRFVGL
ncbi:MAG: thioredoxin domain-containing protein [Nitrospirota bacterium]|nr:thioredoxin domain-containing protein [Nitrospirota bacterium]